MPFVRGYHQTYDVHNYDYDDSNGDRDGNGDGDDDDDVVPASPQMFWDFPRRKDSISARKTFLIT